MAKINLSVKIMATLAVMGKVQRKKLFLPFQSEYSYGYFAVVVRDLLKDGLLKISRQYKINFIELTPLGIQRVKQMKLEELGVEEYKRILKEENGKIRRNKRRSLVADLIMLCRASDILTLAKDKPRLESFYSPKAHISDELVVALNNGIFYSLGEIKKAFLKSADVGGEFSNWTRLVGIILIKNRIYFAYSVGDSLIRINLSCETRTIETIVELLKRSEFLKEVLQYPAKPYCIVAGDSMNMVPKIVYGKKNGTKDESTKQNKIAFRKIISQKHVNAEMLSQIFSAAYFVPVSSQGREFFKVAINLSEQTRELLIKKWLEGKNDSLMRLQGEPYGKSIDSNGDFHFYIPCIDMIEILYLQNQNNAIHLVIPQDTQEVYSRCLGTLLLSAHSLLGHPLQFGIYSKEGYRIDTEKINGWNHFQPKRK